MSWKEIKEEEVPVRLVREGLGAAPVYSHDNEAWYVRQDVPRTGVGDLVDAIKASQGTAKSRYLRYKLPSQRELLTLAQNHAVPRLPSGNWSFSQFYGPQDYSWGSNLSPDNDFRGDFGNGLYYIAYFDRSGDSVLVNFNSGRTPLGTFRFVNPTAYVSAKKPLFRF